MANKKPRAVKEDEDLLGFNLASIDDLLEGIDSEIPAYNIGDRINFVHAGGKISGRVHKVLEEGQLKVTDKAGTLYRIHADDILKEGETASMLISRTKKEGKRPVYKQTDLGFEETPKKKPVTLTRTGDVAKPKATDATKKRVSKGEPTQRELVEALAEKGETDYDVIAKNSGVTRTNVGQYMYRWKKANNK